MSPVSEAQKRATAKWQKSNTKVVTIRLQCKGDKDILDYLSDKSTATEFKKALRYYMEHCKQEYRYGMRLRGYSPGAQPRGVLRTEEDKTGTYHDILVYDRQLSADEVSSYDLDELGEA